MYNQDKLQVTILVKFGLFKYFLNIINSFKPVVPFMDIGKQYSPRCDAAERGVPSGAILFA